MFYKFLITKRFWCFMNEVYLFRKSINMLAAMNVRPGGGGGGTVVEPKREEMNEE